MSEQYKKTALQLYGLAKRDQRWLLRQLPTEQRQKVKQHMSELARMGVPGIPALVDQVSGDNTLESGIGYEKYDNAAIVNGLSSQQISEILENEPDWILATILAAGEWDWTREFLARLDPFRREHVCQLAEHSDRFRRVHSSLIKFLADSQKKEPLQPRQNRFESLLRDIEHNQRHLPITH